MLNRSQIEDACAAAADRYHVTVTPQAMELIAYIIASVTADPHPSWPTQDATELDKIATDYAERLPEILEYVARRVGGRSITTFDVLTLFNDFCSDYCFT